MRFVVAFVLLTACTSSDLDATAQGVCSGLDPDTCAANAQCQPAFIDDSWSPIRPFHCLALEGTAQLQTACPQDRDGCRSTHDCSPIFHQRLGPTDAPEGDPTYSRCEATELVLASDF